MPVSSRMWPPAVLRPSRRSRLRTTRDLFANGSEFVEETRRNETRVSGRPSARFERQRPRRVRRVASLPTSSTAIYRDRYRPTTGRVPSSPPRGCWRPRRWVLGRRHYLPLGPKFPSDPGWPARHRAPGDVRCAPRPHELSMNFSSGATENQQSARHGSPPVSLSRSAHDSSRWDVGFKNRRVR